MTITLCSERSWINRLTINCDGSLDAAAKAAAKRLMSRSASLPGCPAGRQTPDEAALVMALIHAAADECAALVVPMKPVSRGHVRFFDDPDFDCLFTDAPGVALIESGVAYVRRDETCPKGVALLAAHAVAKLVSYQGRTYDFVRGVGDGPMRLDLAVSESGLAVKISGAETPEGGCLDGLNSAASQILASRICRRAAEGDGLTDVARKTLEDSVEIALFCEAVGFVGVLCDLCGDAEMTEDQLLRDFLTGTNRFLDSTDEAGFPAEALMRMGDTPESVETTAKAVDLLDADETLADIMEDEDEEDDLFLPPSKPGALN